ncbi:MAG: branched-chain amino acid ABC transporter permease [Phototrophicaceae bacterium]|jgi:branched-chain amino acid transport system permease protein
MVKSQTWLMSVYIAIGAIILALTGVFGSFAPLLVIEGESFQLNMSSILLVLITGGTAFYIAARLHDSPFVTRTVNSVISGLIVAALLGLMLFVLYTPQGTLYPAVTFAFPNLSAEMFTILTFGQGLWTGLILLLLFGAGFGLLAALAFSLPNRIRRTLLGALALTFALGLLQAQVKRVITLSDILSLIALLVPGYLVSLLFGQLNPYARLGIGAVAGIAVGGLIAVLVNAGTIPVVEGSILLTRDPLWVYLLVTGALVGILGALTGGASRPVHTGVVYTVISLLVVGIINWQAGMTPLAATLTFILLSVLAWFTPALANHSAMEFERLTRLGQRSTTQGIAVILLLVAFIAPTFLGSSLTYALALVGLYVIMGIGLNIVIGYAGLLDLGHVGFFAIGAYMIGLLTSPSMLTCGAPVQEVLRDPVATYETRYAVDLPQTDGTVFYLANADGTSTVLNCRIWNFWLALPVAVLVAGASGMLLGIPVLRLRGDYLAIVTLGLSEIISIVIASSTFKPWFGSAQGISPIPSPVVDLSWLQAGWRFSFFSADIYYVVVPGILLATFISNRMVNGRIGRAWRSMRADEDVAEAMGIDLVRSKLAAFGISAAFAGLGGAFFAAGLQGTFPNSFTLLVSINVLAMIIIGGLGSIPGVFVGALVLVGLPEILREFSDYRLLVFGILLVVTMLLRPEGLIPPPVRRLSETVTNDPSTPQAERGASAPAGD